MTHRWQVTFEYKPLGFSRAVVVTARDEVEAQVRARGIYGHTDWWLTKVERVAPLRRDPSGL